VTALDWRELPKDRVWSWDEFLCWLEGRTRESTGEVFARVLYRERGSAVVLVDGLDRKVRVPLRNNQTPSPGDRVHVTRDGVRERSNGDTSRVRRSPAITTGTPIVPPQPKEGYPLYPRLVPAFSSPFLDDNYFFLSPGAARVVDADVWEKTVGLPHEWEEWTHEDSGSQYFATAPAGTVEQLTVPVPSAWLPYASGVDALGAFSRAAVLEFSGLSVANYKNWPTVVTRAGVPTPGNHFPASMLTQYGTNAWGTVTGSTATFENQYASGDARYKTCTASFSYTKSATTVPFGKFRGEGDYTAEGTLTAVRYNIASSGGSNGGVAGVREVVTYTEEAGGVALSVYFPQLAVWGPAAYEIRDAGSGGTGVGVMQSATEAGNGFWLTGTTRWTFAGAFGGTALDATVADLVAGAEVGVNSYLDDPVLKSVYITNPALSVTSQINAFYQYTLGETRSDATSGTVIHRRCVINGTTHGLIAVFNPLGSTSAVRIDDTAAATADYQAQAGNIYEGEYGSLPVPRSNKPGEWLGIAFTASNFYQADACTLGAKTVGIVAQAGGAVALSTRTAEGDTVWTGTLAGLAGDAASAPTFGIPDRYHWHRFLHANWPEEGVLLAGKQLLRVREKADKKGRAYKSTLTTAPPAVIVSSNQTLERAILTHRHSGGWLKPVASATVVSGSLPDGAVAGWRTSKLLVPNAARSWRAVPVTATLDLAFDAPGDLYPLTGITTGYYAGFILVHVALGTESFADFAASVTGSARLYFVTTGSNTLLDYNVRALRPDTTGMTECVVVLDIACDNGLTPDALTRVVFEDVRVLGVFAGRRFNRTA
jgi:hypothetical protein